jgi:ABC-type polar amino acid transport system ATPase subunit
MKLTAFRIKNFRSIKDTGWHDLAYDNITCLIGQNESGKTSILEGLKAFHDGVLIEDMLRSDLTMPQVACSFKFDISEFRKNFDMDRLHPDIRNKLDEIENITIIRTWEPDLSSYITAGKELMDVYQAEDEKHKARESKVEKLLEKTEGELNKARMAAEKAEQSLGEINSLLAGKQEIINEQKKISRSVFSRNKRSIGKADTDQIKNECKILEEQKEQKRKEWEEKNDVLKELKEKQVVLDRIREVQRDIEKRNNELTEARERFRQISEIVGMYPSEKELRAAEASQENYRLEINLAKDQLQASRKQYDILLLAAEKVFNNIPFQESYAHASSEISKIENFMGPRELGEGIFSFVPKFEMFEDFSSLLPNRIDLEDILTGNTTVEGYKAAINFLTITGLDYSFFQQPSSRILKQKIENLNGELTLNFQDFWRQNVGKNNKIKINFELAHYDHTHEEKSGKPFIEFWIKDEAERLYPKQRSRGVRWFLSFFMELKATAMDQTQHNKLLLIDEPGVSLHARAQEDVLKVFDDIKEHMQIVYSTHSPHLIDVNKLYRVIAVQRALEDDMKSETIVLNARSLKAATADTLSPVYATMGARLNQQDIIKSFNNVVVKDLATFYFLKAILTLTGYTSKECYFLPASGAASMPMIINILIGWGLEYIALSFGNEEERYIYNKLRKELFDNNVDLANLQLLQFKEFPDAEDIFSTIDFKKYVVHVREGITVKNSEYLKDNNHSRAVVASNFLQSVNRGEIKMNDLDEESRDNLNNLIRKLSLLLK